MRITYLILFVMAFTWEGSAQKYLLEQDVNLDTLAPKLGPHRKFESSLYLGAGFVLGPSTNNPPSSVRYLSSWQFREGVWLRMKVTRRFSLGGLVEYARDAYRLATPIIGDSIARSHTKWTRQINNNAVVGLFSRINLKRDRVFLDVGGYYAFDLFPKIQTKERKSGMDYDFKKTTYHVPKIMNRNNYGIDCRLTFANFAIYSRYRISQLYKQGNSDLPKIVFGVLVDVKD